MPRHTLIAVTTLILVTQPLLAKPKPETGDKPITGETLILRDLQGGFAGFTGIQMTIHADGKWTSEKVFNEKLTPLDSGKLTVQQQKRFTNLLNDNLKDKLPEEIGGPPRVNPHLVELKYGKIKTTLVLPAGQAVPDPTAENTPQQRVIRVYTAARNLTKPKEKPKEKPES